MKMTQVPMKTTQARMSQVRMSEAEVPPVGMFDGRSSDVERR